MIKFLKSKSFYKYLLPSSFSIVYDLVPFFKVADHIQNTKLSPEARKRLKWMDYYQQCQNVAQTCRHFDIPRKPSIIGRRDMTHIIYLLWKIAAEHPRMLGKKK